MISLNFQRQNVILNKIGSTYKITKETRERGSRNKRFTEKFTG